MRRVFIIISLSSILYLISINDSISSNKKYCNEKLSRVIDVIYKETDTNKVKKIDMKVYSILEEKDQKDTISYNIQFISKRGRSFFKANDVEIYEDNDYSYSLLHKEKKIYVFKNQGGTITRNELLKQRLLIDSLQKKSEILECDTVKNKDYDYIIKFKTSNESGYYLGFPSVIEFRLNMNSKSLFEIIYYYEQYKYSKSIFHFNEINNNYRTSKFDVPVDSLIYNNDGKLKTNFSGYKIRDIRKRK